MAPLLALLLSLDGLRVELPSNPRIGLGWYDGFHLCPVMKPIVQEEVTKIFSSIGVTASWEDEPGARDMAAAVNVILIRQHPTDWGLEPATLGIVMGRDRPLTAYAFASRAFRVLGHIEEKPHECPGLRSLHEVSRALGRVIAHEIVHTIAPDHPHADEGLMHGKMDRQRLLAAETVLDAECARAFLVALSTMTTSRSYPSAP